MGAATSATASPAVQPEKLRQSPSGNHDDETPAIAYKSRQRVDATELGSKFSVASAEVRILSASYQFLILATALLNAENTRELDMPNAAAALERAYAANGELHLDPACLELAVALQQAFSGEDVDADDLAAAESIPEAVSTSASVHASSCFEKFLAQYSSYKTQPLACACHAAWESASNRLLPEQGARASAPVLGLSPDLLEPLQELLQQYSAVDGTVSVHALEEVAGSAVALDDDA